MDHQTKTPRDGSGPRLENLIRVFHEDCGGIAVGPIDDLHCAECNVGLDLVVVPKRKRLLAVRVETDTAHDHDIARFDAESPAAQ